MYYTLRIYMYYTLDVSMSVYTNLVTIAVCLYSWYPKVINLYSDEKLMGLMAPAKETSFYNSSCTLVGNLVRGMLTRSVESLVSQLSSDSLACLPIFRVRLCFHDNKLVFDPSLKEVEDSVVFVIFQIGKCMQNIPHLKVCTNIGIFQLPPYHCPSHLLLAPPLTIAPPTS